jgi:hypothetical protein
VIWSVWSRSRSAPRVRKVKGQERSTRGVVRSDIDVKTWKHQTPSVGAVRPSRCPACLAPSRPVGEGLVLHGHGTRARQFRGPAAPMATPEIRVVDLRRYECQRCGAVTTVGPAETLTKRLYSAAAIAWALALFGLSLLSSAAVRELVSPSRIIGYAAAPRWATLSRWCAAAAEGRLFEAVRSLAPSGTARQVAETVAVAVGAYALPSPSPPAPDVLAFLGATHAR